MNKNTQQVLKWVNKHHENQGDWTNPHYQHDELHQWDFFSRRKFPTNKLVQLYNLWRNSKRSPNGLQLYFVLSDSVQAVDVLLLLQLNTNPPQWIVHCTHLSSHPIWKTKCITDSNTDTNLFDCQLQRNSSVIHHFTSVEAGKKNHPITNTKLRN